MIFINEVRTYASVYFKQIADENTAEEPEVQVAKLVDEFDRFIGALCKFFGAENLINRDDVGMPDEWGCHSAIFETSHIAKLKVSIPVKVGVEPIIS